MNEPGVRRVQRKSASTLGGTSNQLGGARSTQATPGFSGSKFANANKGVTTIPQLL